MKDAAKPAEPLVSRETHAGVMTVTLGAPPAHPLSLAMIAALHETIEAAAQDDEVRAVILHGPGRIFCAGHDLKEIARHRADPDRGRAYLTRLFQDCAAMMQALARCPKPTLAVVEGIATAGGLQLMASCDLALASSEARFCLPGIRRGGFCTTPSVAVSRVIGRQALMELLLTGTPKDAGWALRTGLVARVLPAGQLLAEAQALARDIAENFTPVAAAGKSALARHIELPLDAAYRLATEAMIEHFMDPARIAREREDPIARRA